MYHYFVLVDCGWTPWTSWTDCSQTCGAGNKTRSRSVANTAHSGGLNCAGTASETQQCTIIECPSEYNND